jgi:hypothetical protein
MDHPFLARMNRQSSAWLDRFPAWSLRRTST